jgi:hypothetical protein
VRGSSELVASVAAPHIIALHGYSSSSYCRARTRLGLATSQVSPRPSLPSYRRARSRCPPCGSASSRHTSALSTHARTARVLGPHRAATHASESALRATALSTGRSPPLGSCSCAHTPTPPASAPCLLQCLFLPSSRTHPVPVPAHACSRVARARSEPQTHACCLTHVPGPLRAPPRALSHHHLPRPCSGAAPTRRRCQPTASASAQPAAWVCSALPALPRAPRPPRSAPGSASPPGAAPPGACRARSACLRTEPLLPGPAFARARAPAHARPRAPERPPCARATCLRVLALAQSLPPASVLPAEEGKQRERGDKDGCAADGEKRKEGRRQDKEEERRKTDGLFQGLIRNFRKLQGLFYKAKFPINPKS